MTAAVDNPFFARVWLVTSGHEPESVRRLRVDDGAGRRLFGEGLVGESPNSPASGVADDGVPGEVRRGDVIAVGWLRPVALYVFTIGCALVLGALMAELFSSQTADNFWYVLLFLFVGAFVGYFVGKMLLQKKLYGLLYRMYTAEEQRPL